MSYRPETEFGILVGEILADLERLRPGLRADLTVAELQAQLGERIQIRLGEVYREFHVDEGAGEHGSGEAAQLELYRREVAQILLPRYAALAHAQNRRESLARGADVYNRVAYTALFFILGLLVVWAPFIPIWEKWIPFALAAVAPLVSPWLPDLQRALHKRRHQIALDLLHIDLDHAGRALPLPPLSLALEPGAASRAEPRRLSDSAAVAPPVSPVVKDIERT